MFTTYGDTENVRMFTVLRMYIYNTTNINSKSFKLLIIWQLYDEEYESGIIKKKSC